MCESVLTHTSPCPPPGAGVAFVAASVVARVAGAGVAAAGLPDAEVFGLNKSPNVGLEGDAEGAGLAAASVFAFLRLRLAAGEAEVAGVAFGLRGRFPAGEGEAAASAAGEGEVAGVAFGLRGRLLAGEGEAAGSAFLCVRCFFGEGDSAGDPAGAGD
jgi:hypothetical protein